MPDILRDLSEQALIKAIEGNMYAMTPFSHGWPQAEVYAGEDVSWCVTDVAFPTCNPIFHVRLKPEAVESLLESLIAKARLKKINLHCWVTRDTKPANLAEYLTAYGFTTVGEGAGMAIDLLAMKDDVPEPSGLEIIEVRDEGMLKTWSHVTGVGFGIPEHAEPTIFEWFSTDIKYNQPLKCYLGIWQGKPVATSSVFYAEGVAGIYFVATLPEERCQGIGFAVTQRPLLEARDMGYRVGILQASKMGEPVYRRMGFREYSRIGSYSWIYQPE
jgi:GNAT superfamily N-acetyltransferase